MPIAPILYEEFKSPIWRMEIDELTETLFVETRDSKGRSVYFSAISLIDGSIFFRNIQTPEKWLTGLEAAYNGVVLLHFYEAENSPVHKGLIALDGLTGETLWSNFNLAFDHLSANGPVVYDNRIQPRKLFLLDVKTGATIRTYQPSLDSELPSLVIVPKLIAADSLPFVVTGAGTVEKLVHYHEHNYFRIVSLHALNQGQLSQLLLIFEETEPGQYREVFRDLLNDNIQKLQPEAFIVHKDRLIYIRKTSGLIMLKL